MALTKNMSEVVQALVDLTRANWEAIELPGPECVYYGQQVQYTKTPSVSYIGGTTTRELTQTGMQATITFPVSIIIYHAQLKDVMEVGGKVLDELAEKLVGVLDTDKTLGGLIVHGLVVRSEPGYASQARSIYRASRLSWSGFSKVHI